MLLCRMCLGQDSAQFYSFSYGKPTIRQKVNACIPELEDDFLNDGIICDHCLANLYIAYDFKNKCLAAQKLVQNIVKNNAGYNNLNDLLVTFCDPTTNTPQITQQTPLNGLQKLVRIDKTNPVVITSKPAEKKKVREEENYDCPQKKAKKSDEASFEEKKNGMKIVEFSSFEDLAAQNILDLPECSSEDKGVNITAPRKDQEETNKEDTFIKIEDEGEEVTRIEDIGDVSIEDEIAIDNFKDEEFQPVPSFEVKVNRLQNTKIICNVCYKYFTTKQCFKRHLKVAHNIEIPMKDKYLDTVLSSLPAKYKENIAKSMNMPCNPMICKPCNITLNCSHAYAYHFAGHHRNMQVNPISFDVNCNICKNTFNHKYLNIHVNSHKCKIELSNIFKDYEGPKEGPFLLVKYWKCDVCNLYYNTSKDSISHHKYLHKNMKLEYKEKGGL